MTDDPKPSRRQRNLAEIRTRAIPVAERIVFENGVDALHARGLAKELNISVGSLYNAFGDLDGVFRAINARCARMLSAKLQDAIDTAPQDRRARLVALGEAYFDFALAEPERWFLLFEHRSNLKPDAKTQEIQQALLEMLIETGEADSNSEQQRQFYLMLWASVHGLVSLACRPTIVTMEPELARTFIGDLVDATFRAAPLES